MGVEKQIVGGRRLYGRKKSKIRIIYNFLSIYGVISISAWAGRTTEFHPSPTPRCTTRTPTRLSFSSPTLSLPPIPSHPSFSKPLLTRHPRVVVVRRLSPKQRIKRRNRRGARFSASEKREHGETNVKKTPKNERNRSKPGGPGADCNGK